MAELSPAADAVLTAVTLTRYDVPPEGLFAFAEEMAPLIVAALRAAADQVVPVPIDAKTPEEHWALLGVKNRLLAIADELEAQ